jgi:Tfp pilus assembly protein PilF
MIKRLLLITCLSILPLGLVACSGPTPDQLIENRVNIQEFIDRGIARANAGDAKGMNVAFDKALAIDPKSTKVLVSRGFARSTLKDYKGAVADQTAALAISPDLPEAYANRGTAHYRIGEKKLARADWQKAAALFKANKNMSKYNDLVDVLDQFH